jgi:hypothetical protein
MKTRIVLPDELVQTWDRYVDLLNSALKHGCGETSLAEWLRRLMAMQAQLWAVETEEGNLKGVALTQFIDYGNHKTIHLVLCAGADWPEWAHLHKDVEDFGSRNGCIAVEQWGRAGWARQLPKFLPGYRAVYQVMRKDLPQGVTKHD